MTKQTEDTESLKKENELLHQKTQKQEEEIREQADEIHKKEEKIREQADEIKKKEEENRKQADEIKKKEEENELLKSLLFSTKEKPGTFQIVDYKDYEVESVIGEGGTSSVKIVTKKEKYAQKELKEITFEQAKRDPFRMRDPCHPSPPVHRPRFWVQPRRPHTSTVDYSVTRIDVTRESDQRQGIERRRKEPNHG